MQKTITGLIGLLGCAVLTVTAWAQSRQPMPQVEGENLADKMKNWSNAKKRESSPSAQPKDRDAIPLVYTKVESTPLRWTVSAGNTTPELKIQRRK